MNGWLTAASILAALLAIGHTTGGHRFVFRPMTEASFDAMAQRTMVFVWHFTTLALFMTAVGLAVAATIDGTRALGLYLLIQSAGLALVHLATAATSGLPRWPVKMPQSAVFGVLAVLIAIGLAPFGS